MSVQGETASSEHDAGIEIEYRITTELALRSLVARVLSAYGGKGTYLVLAYYFIVCVGCLFGGPPYWILAALAILGYPSILAALIAFKVRAIPDARLNERVVFSERGVHIMTGDTGSDADWTVYSGWAKRLGVLLVYAKVGLPLAVPTSDIDAHRFTELEALLDRRLKGKGPGVDGDLASPKSDPSEDARRLVRERELVKQIDEVSSSQSADLHVEYFITTGLVWRMLAARALTKLRGPAGIGFVALLATVLFVLARSSRFSHLPLWLPPMMIALTVSVLLRRIASEVRSLPEGLRVQRLSFSETGIYVHTAAATAAIAWKTFSKWSKQLGIVVIVRKVGPPITFPTHDLDPNTLGKLESLLERQIAHRS